MNTISEQVQKLRDYRDDIRFAPSVRKVFGEAADTIETLSEELSAANIERSAGHYGVGWIECADRLPTMEECQKNDCRFILDDGNRRYQGIFGYTEKKFMRFDFFCGMQEDKCVVAWQPLPEPYHEP